MWILGIQKQSDASVCLLHDGNIVYYHQEERLSRHKKDTYPFKTIQEIKKYTDHIDEVIFSGYSFTEHENQMYHKMLVNESLIDPNQTWIEYNESHHLFHAANAFYNSGFDQAVCIVWDGHGSEFKLKNGNIGSETTTVYTCEYPNNINPIFKRIFLETNHRGHTKNVDNSDPGSRFDCSSLVNDLKNCKVEFRKDFDSGHMYEAVSHHLGFGYSECGKTMGLSAYGKNNEHIPDLVFRNDQNQYYSNMNLFLDRFHLNSDLYKIISAEAKNKYNLTDLSFKLQKSVEEKNLQFILDVLKETGTKNLVLSGGVSLNVVANYFYKKNMPADVNLYIEPICEDYGNSIGAAKYHWHKLTLDKTVRKIKDLYLGPTPKYNYSLKHNEQEKDITFEQVAELLADQHLVAVFQSRSEAGPRALGNRSLLFDPRNPDGKDKVNEIKKREWFRPFAGSIAEEYSHEWFDMANLDSSPFMMYAVNVLPNKAEKIPAITHEDGTCRIQTVSMSQNENFYHILKCFYNLTEVPILLNTSFNLAGEPLVESISDAINTLRNSKIEYLFLPDNMKLIYIKND